MVQFVVSSVNVRENSFGNGQFSLRGFFSTPGVNSSILSEAFNNDLITLLMTLSLPFISRLYISAAPLKNLGRKNCSRLRLAWNSSTTATTGYLNITYIVSCQLHQRSHQFSIFRFALLKARAEVCMVHSGCLPQKCSCSNLNTPFLYLANKFAIRFLTKSVDWLFAFLHSSSSPSMTHCSKSAFSRQAFRPDAPSWPWS